LVVGRWSLLVLLLAGLVPDAHAQARLQVGQPDASQFPEVQLFVQATGARGEPLAGLTAGHFTVTEDGRPATITAFRDAGNAVPLEVCLAIDRSGSMAEEGKFASAQAAARQFLTSMRPVDRAGIVSFASGATLDQSLTGDIPALDASVTQLRPGGGTTFYDGAFWAVQQVSLRTGRPGVLSAGTAGARRVVLALTDGNDNESHSGPADVIRQARANGVTIYTIGLGSDASRADLERLATATGGRFYHAPTARQLAHLYARIGEQFRSEYAITYRTPRPALDGTRREVEVRLLAGDGATGLSRDGASEDDRPTPMAKTWYQAPGAGSLVVTVNPGSKTAGPSVATPSGPPALLSFALIGIVVAIGLVAVVWLLVASRRPRGPTVGSPRSPRRPVAPSGIDPGEATVAIPGFLGRASNPPIDLLPLHAKGTITRVGRATENDVVIDSALVSRRHARIERAGGAYRIFDQGSTHGTYVNGRRVDEAEITVGDVIHFADRGFRFAGDAPA
jgi:VWFA-related protein